MIPIEKVREQAAGLGIQGIEQMDRKELIRAIQVKEGHTPCYGTDWCKSEWRETCAWKDECSAEEYFSDDG